MLAWRPFLAKGKDKLCIKSKGTTMKEKKGICIIIF